MAAPSKKAKTQAEPLYPYELKADPSSRICEDAILKGSITVGANTVIHPFASVLAHVGPIVIGSYCILEEGSIIENHSKEPMIIGNDNLFEVHAWCQAQSVGNENILGVRSAVYPGINISDHCIIGEMTTLSPTPSNSSIIDTLPPRTVVSGPTAARQTKSNHGEDQEKASRRMEIENLKLKSPTLATSKAASVAPIPVPSQPQAAPQATLTRTISRSMSTSTSPLPTSASQTTISTSNVHASAYVNRVPTNSLTGSANSLFSSTAAGERSGMPPPTSVPLPRALSSGKIRSGNFADMPGSAVGIPNPMSSFTSVGMGARSVSPSPARDQVPTAMSPPPMESYGPSSSNALGSPLLQPSHSSSSFSSVMGGQDQDDDEEPVIVGVCAMDVKARSKAMREILTRLKEIGKKQVEVKLFGDIVILEEDIEAWPKVDVLISFFSTDFPLPKAIAYTQLPNPTRPTPISINSLSMQSLLWDRRLVLAILDHIGVPTPRRAEVSRDGGPKVRSRLRERVRRDLGLVLPGPRAAEEENWKPPVLPPRVVESRARAFESGKRGGAGLKTDKDVPRGREVILREDGNAIIIDGQVIEKPFVEKPVDGEDHRVYIYNRGGGGRRLFRKVGNKSSEEDPTLWHPRTDGSYIYEEFINVDNAEDIKIYTVGANYCHAETRKSPVVDGLVRRNADGKETRFITQLSTEEKEWCTDIVESFVQRVCGFDLLRCTAEDGTTRSMIIDVNGWSFVKGNQAYYDKAAEILSSVCQTQREKKRSLAQVLAAPGGASTAKPKAEAPPTSSSTLRATVTVLRHADRSPKQKLKLSVPADEPWTKPFLRLLRGQRNEIILRDPAQVDLILKAADEAVKLGTTEEIAGKLEQMKEVLLYKMNLPGTKAQLKPSFGKEKGKSKNKKVKEQTHKDDEGDAAETEARESSATASRARVKEWVEEAASLATPTPANATLAPYAGNDVDSAEAKRTPVLEPVPQTRYIDDSTADSLQPMPTPASSQISGGDLEPVADDDAIPEGLEKMQVIVKWGGESTHSARYQMRDLGETFKKDLALMNKDVLNNVKIYTSSERRVVASASIFADALLGKEERSKSASQPQSPALMRKPTDDYKSPYIEHLIQRRDLLDDNNAAKDPIEHAKKQLKLLLRPGESEKRPELAWPKSVKKEPVEIVKEVIEQLTDMREILRRNYANGNAEKIAQRWCSGDDRMLFRERWEKLFEDFVGRSHEKFDPARVSELYDSLKYDALHHRTFLLSIFNSDGKVDKNDGKVGSDRRVHELYWRAKALFDLVAPQEYGLDWADKEEIGVLTSLPLLRKIVADLTEAKDTGTSMATFWFTKESHVISYLHLLLASGLPLKDGVVQSVRELDYSSMITLELWSTISGGKTEYSIRMSVSEGAHVDFPLDSSVDARHTLSIQPRKRMTEHVGWDDAMTALTKHFSRQQIFSTTPVEGDAVYLKKSIDDVAVLPLAKLRGDAAPRVISSAASDRTHASDW